MSYSIKCLSLTVAVASPVHQGYFEIPVLCFILGMSRNKCNIWEIKTENISLCLVVHTGFD